jgi:hypothetical protein
MPGKEIVLRPVPQAPVPAAPPWPQAPASESGIKAGARWVRRNGHITVPLAVPPALWLAALVLHQLHPAAYVVPLCGALLAACIWVFAPHKWDRPAEQWYARLSAALGALWLSLAAWSGPVRGFTAPVVLASVLLAGCIAWGIPWWRHKRPRGMKKRQKLIAQCDAWWQSHCHNWSLHGSRVTDARLSGVTLQMRVRGIPGRHTVQHFREAVPYIESAAEGHADIGLVRVEAVKGKPCEVDLFLKQANPLEADVEYDMALAPQSVHDLAPHSRTETGQWKMTSLRRNRLTIGATRTGKSNDLLVAAANLSGCADARTVLIDLKGGRSARPVLESGAAEYVITGVDEARMYLRMSVAEILARAKYAYDGSEQLHATEDIPAIITMIDETHGLTSTMNGDAECARLLATGASQGSGLEWYVYVYTQFGSLEESVRTEQTRGNLTLRTCYRVEEARHGAYVIPEYNRLDASALEEKGTAYIKDGPRVLAEQVRAPRMPHELLARIAAQNARLIGPRPPLALYCGGETAYRDGDGDVTWREWWDARWLRLDPAFREISPQYQAAAAEYGTPVTQVTARRADSAVPSPGPGTGDAASAAARLAADDADLMSRIPADFRPDPELVRRLPAALASQEDRFADALEAADASSPVTPGDLMQASGFGKSWIHDRLNALVETGFVTQVTRGRYVTLPGMDIRQGLQGIKDRNDQLNKEARQKINAA